MSWSRVTNVFRGSRLSREIDEELQAHLAEAIEQGRDPAEARRALGLTLQLREASLDIRLVPWFSSLASDAVIGWRQIRKNRLASAAAVLSLALAIGACLAAFRLIDALLLRPMPVADAARLYVLSRRSVGPDGAAVEKETCAYSMFRQMRAAVRDEAELIAADSAARIDLTYSSVGLAADALYGSIREPLQPVAYFPFQLNYARGSLIVRASGANPMALASMLGRELARARPEFRVSGIRTQAEIVDAQTLRERLLALLALFFAVVALALAGIGLYGVLDDSAVARRREIGIRMAIGARPADIARRVTAELFAMVAAGTVAGVALGMGATRYIAALLFQVKPADPAMLVAPSVALVAVGLAGALPAVLHAVGIDPVAMLRAD